MTGSHVVVLQCFIIHDDKDDYDDGGYDYDDRLFMILMMTSHQQINCNSNCTNYYY